MMGNLLMYQIYSTVILCCLLVQPAVGENSRVTDEFEIDANIETVWRAFTTNEGLQSWAAPLADIDLRVGGKWRSNYNPDGQLGDETTIENTILSYDPMRMLSLKATGFPKDFAFAEAAKETWSVFYFSSTADNKTKITIVGLGYNETEQSQQMRSFFKPANEYSMGQLKLALEQPDSEQQDQ